jgi:hypothetical protein
MTKVLDIWGVFQILNGQIYIMDRFFYSYAKNKNENFLRI